MPPSSRSRNRGLTGTPSCGHRVPEQPGSPIAESRSALSKPLARRHGRVVKCEPAGSGGSCFCRRNKLRRAGSASRRDKALSLLDAGFTRTVLDSGASGRKPFTVRNDGSGSYIGAERRDGRFHYPTPFSWTRTHVTALRLGYQSRIGAPLRLHSRRRDAAMYVYNLEIRGVTLDRKSSGSSQGLRRPGRRELAHLAPELLARLASPLWTGLDSGYWNRDYPGPVVAGLTAGLGRKAERDVAKATPRTACSEERSMDLLTDTGPAQSAGPSLPIRAPFKGGVAAMAAETSNTHLPGTGCCLCRPATRVPQL